jgi:hypothetical protein
MGTITQHQTVCGICGNQLKHCHLLSLPNAMGTANDLFDLDTGPESILNM